MIYFIS